MNNVIFVGEQMKFKALVQAGALNRKETKVVNPFDEDFSEDSLISLVKEEGSKKVFFQDGGEVMGKCESIYRKLFEKAGAKPAKLNAGFAY
tara:strand:- start:408 stop:680 length:273 start_codon:yes stop_codon:yes gene_type:complete